MDALLALEKALQGDSDPQSMATTAAGAPDFGGSTSGGALGARGGALDMVSSPAANGMSGVGSGLSEDPKESVQCVGCGRDRDTGKCFSQSGDPVSWASKDRRGSWCKDCFTTWRTVYSHSHSQTLMVSFLRNEDNYKEWEACLVAFLTLRLEGAERVTQSMVRTRVDTLQFYCRVLSLPTGPFVAKPLVEVLGGDPSLETISLVRQSPLFTMRSTNGDTVGVFLPTSDAEDASKANIMRPSLPTLPILRNTLFVSSENDRTLCTEHLGVAAETPVSTDIMVYKGGTAQGASLVSRLRALGCLCGQCQSASRALLASGMGRHGQGEQLHQTPRQSGIP